MSAAASEALPLDVVVFGGGGAGLWLLDELVRRGDRALLLESGRLGGGQTVCSQGIIHGGLKYALDRVLTKSASAIRDMPAVWRACLAGARAPDLSNTPIRAERCQRWRTESIASRLGMIGARVGLRAAAETVAADDRPTVLAECPGTVAAVAEQVIDPVGLVADLAGRHAARILHIDAEGGLDFTRGDNGVVTAVELVAPGGGGDRITLAPRRIVLAAGAGNGPLGLRLGLPERGGAPIQQKRPLHMFLMRGSLPALNGHCVDGARTRVTVSSAVDSAGRTVWQVGGQLAEDGVSMEPDEFMAHAVEEIRSVLPGLDLSGLEWTSYRIDRAEAAASGRRPDDASVRCSDNVIVAWPTKLALVPRLSEKIIERLDAPSGAASTELDERFRDWPKPDPAPPPWETAQKWFTNG